MSTSNPKSATSASLLGVVTDAALAAYLLDNAKLAAPVKLRVTLPGDALRRHLRGDVNRALTAVVACDDPAALDRGARDSRITVRRAVAANKHISAATVSYLMEKAVQLGDAELLDPLLGRVDPAELVALLTDPARPVSMSLRSAAAVTLVRNAASAGGMDLVAKLSRFVPRALVAQALGGIRPDEGFDFASQPHDVLADVVRDELFDAVTCWTVERARWAVSVVGSLPTPTGSPYGLRYSRHHTSVTAEVAADAAEVLLAPDLPRSQRIRFAGYVARDPVQAHRHLGRICEVVAESSESAGVGNYARAVLHDLVSAVGGRLSEQEHRSLVELVLEHAPSSVFQMPAWFGDGLPFDVQLRLLQNGGVPLTLQWLRGVRFAEPTPERVGTLVADPGSAFSVRNTGLNPTMWAPSPVVPGLPGAAAGWLLALATDLPDWVGRFDEAAEVASNLTADVVLAAVDAAGAAGMAAAVSHPEWLYRLIADQTGDAIEVWENILNLAGGWEQSLSELVATAALLAGVTLPEKAPPPADTEPQAGVEEQLTLL